MDKELSLEEIHRETLGVLKKLIQICDDIHINYFLAYGSLIGAVRHHGYIPWDDDMDLWMTRPEFEKFVKYCETNAEALLPYKLVSYKNTEGYPYGIPRFCDTTYRMETKAHNVELGTFIDIYPLDGLGHDVREAKKKVFLPAKLWKKLNKFKRSKRYIRSASFLLNIPNYLIYIVSRLFTNRFYLDQLNNLTKTYSVEESDYLECYTWADLYRPKLKECFMGYELLDFEGIKVKVPKGYDKILRDMYGDYMKLPPLEQQKTHHNYRLYRK